MDYLVKDKKLKLRYEPGKGAWTYHIQIPNTKHIIGKWGSLKVTGYIDNYRIDSINLFTITGQDKLISVNEKVRKTINKTAGDTVIVTLSLLITKKQIAEKEILDTFKDSEVLKIFMNLTEDEKQEIIRNILTQKSEEKQIKSLIGYIDKLAGKNNTY
jgi:hypothetical protein